MRQAAGEEGPRGPRGPHAAPARVHTGLRSQGERGTHRSVQGGCLTPTPTSHRPEVQRVADDAPVGGTQFPGPSSGRSGGSQCPPPRGWRWLWVPCRRQAGTGLPGTCGALCYALVDGLVLKNHAPAAGGSFPPSPAQPGGCHRRAPQTCPGAEGHPLRVGVPRGGAGGARTAVCADLRERGHLLWLLLWVSQMSSPGPNGFPFFSWTSQGSGTPWAAQKMALLPRGLDCGHERKWGELGTEGGGTLPGPAPPQDPMVGEVPRTLRGRPLGLTLHKRVALRRTPAPGAGRLAAQTQMPECWTGTAEMRFPVPRTWMPSTPMARPPAGRRGGRAGKGQGPGSLGGGAGRRARALPGDVAAGVWWRCTTAPLLGAA